MDDRQFEFPENCEFLLYWILMSPSKLDFDTELSRGLDAYNDTLAEWWLSRAGDPCHARAYRNIGAFIHASLTRPPGVIVDYACGAGHLLARIGALFPDSRLIGLDGSNYLLRLARDRLKRAGSAARLLELQLPAKRLPGVTADLVLYAFPNMIWPAGRRNLPVLPPAEVGIARCLARERDPGSTDEATEEVYSFLSIGRLIALDLHRILRRGRLCVRVEYAAARRDELSRLDFTRISFEEGSLESMADGHVPRLLFRVLASAFFRSGVIKDVYEQRGKRHKGGGGYLVTVLRAL